MSLPLTWIQPKPSILSREVFSLGTASIESVEPFDLVGPGPVIESVETFWLIGPAGIESVEVFDLAGPAVIESVEPFDMLGADDVPEFTLPSDTGPVAPAILPYGWWLPDADGYEDVGDVVTD